MAGLPPSRGREAGKPVGRVRAPPTAVPHAFRALETAGTWDALFLRGSEPSPVSQRSRGPLPSQLGAGIQQAYDTGAARRRAQEPGRGRGEPPGRSPVEPGSPLESREARAPPTPGSGRGRAADAPGRRVTAPRLPGNGAGRRAGGAAVRGVGAAGLQHAPQRAAPSPRLRAGGALPRPPPGPPIH